MIIHASPTNNNLKCDVQTKHRYIRLGHHGSKDRYFCLNKNPLLLAWWLYWYGKPFGFRRKGIRQTLSGVKNLFRVVIGLCYYQLNFPNADSVIELPVSGHLCLQVHNGHKVFDLRQNVVTKVFSPEIDLKIVRRQINRARRVGVHPFAPTVRRWNVEERWYGEDYVNGYVAKRESLIPLIERMIMAGFQRQVSGLEYADRLRGIFERKRHAPSNGQMESSNLYRIRSFLDQAIDQLYLEGDRSIFLVFSHGDFSARHVFMTDHGLVSVDWEDLGRRSALFDLYDIFFQRFRHGHIVPEMAKNIDKAISQLQSCLTLNSARDNGSLIASLDWERFYRFIYYVESICLYGGRRKRLTRKGLEKIFLMIAAYQRYEESMKGGDKQTSLNMTKTNRRQSLC